jgi:hypothetical protein
MTDKKFLVTRHAYFVWTVIITTVWLSFLTSVWLAVLLHSASFIWLSVFWLVWLVILVAVPGANKKR